MDQEDFDQKLEILMEEKSKVEENIIDIVQNALKDGVHPMPIIVAMYAQLEALFLAMKDDGFFYECDTLMDFVKENNEIEKEHNSIH